MLQAASRRLLSPAIALEPSTEDEQAIGLSASQAISFKLTDSLPIGLSLLAANSCCLEEDHGTPGRAL